jgi:hypothetical protein
MSGDTYEQAPRAPTDRQQHLRKAVATSLRRDDEIPDPMRPIRSREGPIIGVLDRSRGWFPCSAAASTAAQKPPASRPYAGATRPRPIRRAGAAAGLSGGLWPELAVVPAARRCPVPSDRDRAGTGARGRCRCP